MKYALILTALLMLSGCSNITPPQTTTLLLTTPVAPLTIEARLYSQAVRESIDALNNKNFQQYADSFAADSPERDHLRKTFDLLTQSNASHQFRGAEVKDTSDTKVNLRIEQSLVQGSVAELGYYSYELRPVGDAWKIFKYAPETSKPDLKTPTASASPTPAPSAATNINQTSDLDLSARAVVEANVKAINTQNVDAFAETLHPDSAYNKQLSSIFESITQAKIHHDLLSIEVSEKSTTSTMILTVTRKVSSITGNTRETASYLMKKDKDTWKIFDLTLDSQIPE